MVVRDAVFCLNYQLVTRLSGPDDICFTAALVGLLMFTSNFMKPESHVKYGIWSSLLLILFVLLGCATEKKYAYNNVLYPDPESALAAARNEIHIKSNTIPAAESKIGGTLLMVIPVREIISQYAVKNPSYPISSTTQYNTDILETIFLSRADVVRTGKVFDTVTVVRELDTENYPSNNYDYKLWLLGTGFNSWQWYLAKTGSSRKEPVTMDRGLSGSQRLASFNTALYKAAKMLTLLPEPSASIDAGGEIIQMQ